MGSVSNFGHPIMAEIPRLPDDLDGPLRNRSLAVHTAAQLAQEHGDWAEFGVWRGETAGMLLEHLPEASKLYLFDSYEGLSRDWSALPSGSFKVDNPPVFTDPRVVMVNGWFEDTVREALHDTELSLLHIDCDLYESTLQVLNSVPPLKAGTLILFDEYVHNIGGKPVDDEHRAFTEWVGDRPFRYVWRTNWTQVLVELLA